MRRLFTISFVVASLLLPVGGMAADSLTLQEAVDLALKDSPESAIASARAEGAAARLLEARSAWLPFVQGAETWTHGNNPVFVFGSLLEQGRFGPEHFDPSFLNDPPSLSNYRLALNVRYPVFDQFRRFNGLRASALGVERARQESSLTAQAIRLRVIQAYFGTLIAAAGRDVASQAVQTAEEDVRIIREKFEVGLVVQSDLLAAEVQLAEMKQQLIQAEGGLAVARASLNRLTGRPLLDVAPLEGTINTRSFEPGPLDELVQDGTSRRPEVVAAQLGAKQAAIQLQTARGQFLPRLDAFASLGASGESIGDHDSDHTVGLTLSWNLLDPGRLARAREAAAGAREAEAMSERQRLDAELEIVSAYQNFLAAQQRLSVAERSTSQAEETVRIIRNRYQEGLTSITEQLRAQTALLHSRMSAISARSDYIIQYATLLRTVGRLENVQEFL